MKKLTKLPAETVEAFCQSLPKLLLFVNEKFTLESKYIDEDNSGDIQKDLIADFNKNFGELMMGVYDFSLYENILEEFLLNIAALDSREFNRKFFKVGLKSWILGIQCIVTHPESEQLIHPLEWLHRNFSILYDQVESVEYELDGRVQRFSDLLLKKDRRSAAELLLSFIRDGSSIEDVYSSILVPTLNYIRLLWTQNKISAADQHFLTDICRYVMFRVIDSIQAETRYPFKVLVTCVPGEKDDLGSEFFSNFLEIKGWSVDFIGGAGSEQDIILSIRKDRPSIIAVSVDSIAQLPGAKKLIQRIRQDFPHMRIVMEGHAAVLAQKQLESIADATVSAFEEGHKTMLNLVMPDA